MLRSRPTHITRWRDEPAVPREEDDLASLVKTARRARHAIVEFDWQLSRDDILELQRAVYEWGCGISGRYRVFDARVLAALNGVLGNPNSVFVIQEPSNVRGVDCDVSCVEEGDEYHLRGHATADVIIGYGNAGLVEGTPGRQHLGRAMREVLGRVVASLGWDVLRLHEPQFQAVRNTLYGLPLNYGPPVAPGAGPVEDVHVRFHGPFRAVDEPGCRCLFTDELAKRGGIYMWTVEVDGEEWPWYVGQTRVGFGKRMAQHLSAMLSGEYTPYDVAALAQGRHERAAGAIQGRWPETLPSIIENYESMLPDILGVIRLIRFHLAPMPTDAHLFNRVEGMLGRHYKSHAERRLREFLSPGLKLPAAIPGDSPLRLIVSSEVPIAGLPEELRE